jgi:hypothetical protein
MARIKALLDFVRTTPAALLTRANTVHSSLKNSTVYTRLPVDLSVFRSEVDDFALSTAAALDGGKQAIADRKQKGDRVIHSLLQFAHHAEAHCNGEITTFLESGFEPAPNTRTKTPPLSETIRKIVPGANSGQLMVTLMANRDAFSYELRWAPFNEVISPEKWITRPVVKTRPATLIDSLTPGTLYAFQARILTESGYLDWSDSVTKMCV